jgi:hypothetical protein
VKETDVETEERTRPAETKPADAKADVAAVFQKVMRAIEPLDDAARRRVLRAATELLGEWSP